MGSENWEQSPDAAGASQRSAVPVGSQFNGYHIERVLGESVSTTVFSARDAHNSTIAVKVLEPEARSDESVFASFAYQAERASELGTRLGVPVVDVGDVGGVSFVAYGVVFPTSLRRVLDHGPVAVPAVLQILGEVATIVDDAHAAGVWHRDLKPTNVLLDNTDVRRARAYVVDFSSEQDDSIRNGFYAAPECRRGDPIDGRADVFSFACLVYECLAGVAPFGPRIDEEGDVELWYLHQPAPAFSDDAPTMPKELDAILAKGLALNPSERYATCSALMAAVSGVLAGYQDAPSAARDDDDEIHHFLSRRVLALVVIIAVVVGLGIGAIIGHGVQSKNSNSTTTTIQSGPVGG